MTTSAPVLAEPRARRRVTVAEWLSQPEEKGAELIGGELVYKAPPAPEHGFAQCKLGELLGPFDRRPGGASRPGGWWIAIEVDMVLGGEGVRPDLLGWRRDRLPSLPQACKEFSRCGEA